MLDATVPGLPADRPRYLMGVGRPEDLLEAIRRGIDLFDCVMPTRNGRNAMAFTDRGPLRLRNLQHERDDRPLEEGCPCPACRRSRGYLRHLFMAGEMLGPILLSIHNLTFYQRLLAEARAAIAAGQFEAFVRDKLGKWRWFRETRTASEQRRSCRSSVSARTHVATHPRRLPRCRATRSRQAARSTPSVGPVPLSLGAQDFMILD